MSEVYIVPELLEYDEATDTFKITRYEAHPYDTHQGSSSEVVKWKYDLHQDLNHLAQSIQDAPPPYQPVLDHQCAQYAEGATRATGESDDDLAERLEYRESAINDTLISAAHAITTGAAMAAAGSGSFQWDQWSTEMKGAK